MRRRTTLLTTALLISASPAWAYRPLNGVYKNIVDAPVVTRSVSTSLADKDGKLDSNWDTTIGLEQKDARMVARIDVDVSLLGNQNRTILVRRIVLQRPQPWKQGEQWDYRLQENHLGWPGESTLVQIVSVTFTNGETWNSSNKPEQKLQDLTQPNGKNNATLPANNPNAPYIPPIILPSGPTNGASGSGSAPPVRPRVSPARPPGFSRSAPPTNPVAPRPSQAQPAPIPSSPGAPPNSTPNLGSSNSLNSTTTSPTSPPSQTNSVPPPGGNIPGIPPSSPGNPSPEELLR
jgi:hypothetical protein